MDKLISEWKGLTLPLATNLPEGEFRGHMHFLAMNAFLKCTINLLWRGTVCSKDGKASTLVNLLGSKEVSTVTFSEISTIDGNPCVRIDFEDRFYEGRWRSDDVLLDVVTFKDKSKFVATGNISDVHTLTKTRRSSGSSSQ